jgi:6,7-dimethyl-8-ribityllumazine synthase
MAATHRPSLPVPHLPGCRILLIEGRFYDAINDELLAGAKEIIAEAGGEATVLTVPGALEIPIAAVIALQQAEEAEKPFDGIVALGCVIRGETYHFEVVAGESSRALMDLGVAYGLPLGNGILTVENEAQALVRAKRSEMNKGRGAAEACLRLVALKRNGIV